MATEFTWQILEVTELAKKKYFAWCESFKLLHDDGRQIFEIFQARPRIEEGKDDKSSATKYERNYSYERSDKLGFTIGPYIW